MKMNFEFNKKEHIIPSEQRDAVVYLSKYKIFSLRFRKIWKMIIQLNGIEWEMRGRIKVWKMDSM